MCVVLLKGGKDVSWKGAKAMMSEGNFLKALVEFDKDSLNDKTIKAVKAYFQNAEFTPEAVKSISLAASGLLVWVYAIVNYYGVAKMVNPKRQAVANAQACRASCGSMRDSLRTSGGPAASSSAFFLSISALRNSSSRASWRTGRCQQ